MPEGPEVRTVVDKLNIKFKGKILTKIEHTPNFRHKNGIPGYSQIMNLFPLTLISVFCKGKQIFFEFSSHIHSYSNLNSNANSNSNKDLNVNSNSNKDLSTNKENVKIYLKSFLGMTGRWFYNTNNDVNNDIVDDINKAKCIFTFKTVIKTSTILLLNLNEKLYYSDIRNFGLMEFMDEKTMVNTLSELGPDLLTTDVTLDQWISQCKYSRISKKTIADFLLEQKYFSGIGNYLRTEILYAAKISPHRTMSSLTLEELDELRKMSMLKIRHSYSCKGLTIENYWDPEGNAGVFPIHIYRKNYDPHGYKIITEKFAGDRTVHWVPEIQK
jgi:formamidopyrimidine-DNA glycosylase